MSVIVGIVSGGAVHMGADTYVGNGYVQKRSPAPKLFRRGEIGIGCSGDLVVANAIRFRLKPPTPEEGESDESYVAVRLVDAIREAIKAGGQLKKENEVESACGYLLIGYRGALYHICSDFSSLVDGRGYAAEGAGEQFALGSLHASRAESDIRSRLTVALDSACEFSSYCAPPYIFETIEAHKE